MPILETQLNIRSAEFTANATAMRALDRVLAHGHYSIPQWYSGEFFVGYRPQAFVLPETTPPYYQADAWAVSTWWAAPANR